MSCAHIGLQCVSKTTRHLSFYHNFGKCRPIFKILSLLDFQEKTIHLCYLQLTSRVLLHYRAQFENSELLLNFTAAIITDLFALESKRPIAKTSLVETSQSLNVPSQNVPAWSKRPESNRPHIKITPYPY